MWNQHFFNVLRGKDDTNSVNLREACLEVNRSLRLGYSDAQSRRDKGRKAMTIPIPPLDMIILLSYGVDTPTSGQDQVKFAILQLKDNKGRIV